MPDRDIPVEVFAGDYSEATFLRSLLSSAGIETSLIQGTNLAPLVQPRLLVRGRDAGKARDLIEDFLKHGKRTGVDRPPGKVIDGGW